MEYEFTQQDVQQDARIIERLEARIKELEADQKAISAILDAEAIEHSGSSQAGRVAKLAENYRNRGRMLVQKQLRVREQEHGIKMLEAAFDSTNDVMRRACSRALKAEAALKQIAFDADRHGIGGDAITIDLLTAGAGAIT